VVGQRGLLVVRSWYPFVPNLTFAKFLKIVSQILYQPWNNPNVTN